MNYSLLEQTLCCHCGQPIYNVYPNHPLLANWLHKNHRWKGDWTGLLCYEPINLKL